MSTEPDRSAEPTLRAAGLSKWYGRVTALQDVSVHLGPGIWALLGPNGSGKSTLLHLAAGLLRPSLGQIRVCGLVPFGEPRALRRVGLCPEADALWNELTGLQTVATLAALGGMRPAEARDRAVAALEAFGLRDAMERPVGSYSRGMRQRVKLAQAVVHDPDVLLLDEPLTGTDPASRHAILEEVRRRAARGALVLFSTHVLPEVEALTDRVLLLVRGRIVAQGRVHEIRDMLAEHPQRIHVVCDRPRALGARLLEEPSVAGVRLLDEGLEVETREPEPTYRAVARALVEGGFELRSLTSPDATLEALFHHLVERGARMAGTGADPGVGRARAGTGGP
ncbi:MAG: ABC transporter ATP-binding protein [Myxococcota bacterium]|nr:ABC transporter ATP-binding protein [Myxococcota bacterium]MDW8361932.1 ABC transporter ATP-binding protein [Myxococcales bacterium]